MIDLLVETDAGSPVSVGIYFDVTAGSAAGPGVWGPAPSEYVLCSFASIAARPAAGAAASCARSLSRFFFRC